MENCCSLNNFCRHNSDSLNGTRDHILGRPFMIVMTYKTLDFCIKIPRRLSLEVHLFLSTKQYFMVYS
jgi:hypothetical protein